MVQKWYGNIPLIVEAEEALLLTVNVSRGWNCRSQLAIHTFSACQIKYFLKPSTFILYMVSIFNTLSKLGSGTKSDQLRENQTI